MKSKAMFGMNYTTVSEADIKLQLEAKRITCIVTALVV